MQRLAHCLMLACWAAAALLATDAGAATPLRLHVVGGLAAVHQYTRHEEPFWTQELARLSGGKYEADIVPFNRAGLADADMLRLVQLGVVPLGTLALSSLVARYPEYSAPDLAGLNPDMASLKRSVAAFRPYLESDLRQRHKIEVLAVYVYPAQTLFCKNPITRLTQLRGRRVRVSAGSQADFIAALGGVPIQSEFSKIVASMTSGNTECAITGTMSAHTIALDKVAAYVYTMPISWGLSLFVANRDAWDALPAELRALLRSELPKLEAAIWAESERETGEGLACNTGSAGCVSLGDAGHMQAVSPGPDDMLLRARIVRTQVLQGWLQRCGERCRKLWEQTLGPALKVDLPASTMP